MLSDIYRIEGLYVGQLDDDELWLFEKAVEDKIAYRCYEGVGGFMGMAKVRLNRSVNFRQSSREVG